MKVFWLVFAGVVLAATLPAVLVAATAVNYGDAKSVIWVACAIGIGMGLALALGLAWKVARPLEGFQAFAMQIARGQFGGQVEFTRSSELDELAKTLNYMSASLEAYAAETQRLTDSVEAGYLDTIVALANSLDSKDAYTRGHSQRVADLAVEIGQELGLNADELKECRYGGILHDIGKIGVVESILLKPARLTDPEMVVMKKHPLFGDEIIRPVRFLSRIRAAVRNHHEWWNGQGYPDRLAGDSIPLIARIVACADTWDACTSTRPYQVALPNAEALKVLDGLTGTQLDPKVVGACRRVIERRKPRSTTRPELPSLEKTG